VKIDENEARLTLSDYFDVHLDHAPKEGATVPLDSIVLVARNLSGGRVNIVGLRLPEDEDEVVPLTRMQSFRQKLGELWTSAAGI
jgi:potassium/hydrogen antiporter